MAASVQQRIAFGERAGQRVRRIGSGFGDEGERPALTGTRCASVNGFSLHANTHVPAHRRDQLERLLRYTACGAVSLERLEQGVDGDLLYSFTRPWSDGTTGIKLSPLELLEKLAALVPLPRMHLVRYGGCLAPHSCSGLQSKWTGLAMSAFSGPHSVPLSLPSGPHSVPLSLQSSAPACNHPRPAHINCHSPGSQRQACPQHPIS